MICNCFVSAGKRLIDTILEQHGKWPKTLPKVTDRTVAKAIGEHFLMHETSFFVRAERVDKDKGILMVSSWSSPHPSTFYIYIYSYMFFPIIFYPFPCCVML